MPRLLALLVALGLAGCATSDAVREPEPLPQGSWRGTLAERDVPRPLPATLAVSGGVVELVAGTIRVRSDQASFADGRLRFRAPGFPTEGSGRRAIRCNVLTSEASTGAVRGFVGSCQAGASRYRLTASASSMGIGPPETSPAALSVPRRVLPPRLDACPAPPSRPAADRRARQRPDAPLRHVDRTPRRRGR